MSPDPASPLFESLKKYHFECDLPVSTGGLDDNNDSLINIKGSEKPKGKNRKKGKRGYQSSEYMMEIKLIWTSNQSG